MDTVGKGPCPYVDHFMRSTSKRRRSNKFSLINFEAEEQESLEEQQDAEDHQSVEEDLPISHER